MLRCSAIDLSIEVASFSARVAVRVDCGRMTARAFGQPPLRLMRRILRRNAVAGAAGDPIAAVPTQRRVTMAIAGAALAVPARLEAAREREARLRDLEREDFGRKIRVDVPAALDLLRNQMTVAAGDRTAKRELRHQVRSMRPEVERRR